MPPLSAAVLAVDHARAAGAPRKQALARRRLINELITSPSSLQTSSRQTAPALRSGRLLHTHTRYCGARASLVPRDSTSRGKEPDTAFKWCKARWASGIQRRCKARCAWVSECVGVHVRARACSLPA